MKRRTAWTCVTLAALCAGLSARADDRPALSEEDRADLAWFGALGYPDTAGKPFVRVRLQPNVEVRGFLAEEPGDRIRLLGLGLARWDIERSAPGTPEDRRVVLEHLQAARLAEAWLRGGAPPTEPRDDFPRPGSPSVQTEMLVLADHLHRTDAQRNGALVHGMLAHARSMWPDLWRSRHGPGDLTATLRDRAAADLADVETFRLEMSLVGSSWWGEVAPRGRAEQRNAAQAILRRFPGSADEAQVRELADTLDRMIREAEVRAEAAKPPAGMTEDERIADLVFRLREETPWSFGAMGSPGPIESGPYKDLVARGRAAVPKLLEALGDDSLTNYGGEGRAGMSPYVERVGDLVLRAIDEIAGRQFVPTDPAELPTGDRLAYRRAWREQVRPQIEAWLADPETGRDAASLTKRVEGGGWDAVAAAPLLLAKDADAYAPALLRALVAEKDVRIHYELVGLLARRPGEAGLELIRKVAASGDPRGKLDAVFHLVSLNDPAAEGLLLAAWNERRDGGGLPAYHQYIHIGDREDELTRIATALLATKRPDVVRALAEDPLRRSPAARRVLVRELVALRKDAGADVAALIDSALLVLTADRTEHEYSWSADGKVPGLAWRVCDAAATALAAARGEPVPNASDPFWKRDLTVRAIADANGFSVAPPPPWDPREDPLAAPSELKAQLDVIAATAYGLDARAAAVRAVEAMGLPALPAVRKGLAARSFGFARDVEQLAGRLAFTVRKVIVHGKPPQALRDRVVALEGKVLTSAALREAVHATLAAVNESCKGASLDVDRGPDDLGVVVTLTALDGTSGGWKTSVLAAVGDRFVGPAYGQYGIYAPRDDPSLTEICDAALAAPLGVRSWLHAVAVLTGPN